MCVSVLSHAPNAPNALTSNAPNALTSNVPNALASNVPDGDVREEWKV